VCRGSAVEWVLPGARPGALIIPRPSSYLLKICRTESSIVSFVSFMPFFKPLIICMCFRF